MPDPAKMPVEAVICHIQKGNSILLLVKARGLGKGKFNAPGGKVEPGETPSQCAVREVYEETGLQIKDPKPRGRLLFYFGDRNAPAWIAHVFLAESFQGALHEGGEGSLHWHPIAEVPYEEMWQDDKLWLPLLLEGRNFEGTFYFDESAQTMLEYHLEALPAQAAKT